MGSSCVKAVFGFSSQKLLCAHRKKVKFVFSEAAIMTGD